MQKLGGIAVPVNLGLSTEGIINQINMVQAKCLVVSPEIWTSKLQPHVAQIENEHSAFLTGGESLDGVQLFSSLMDDAAEPISMKPWTDGILCAISFTSGTTETRAPWPCISMRLAVRRTWLRSPGPGH